VKITANRQDLLKLVTRAEAATARRNTTVPILRAVKMTAESELLLQAGDGEISLLQQAKVKVKKPGGLCVPAGRLQDLLQTMHGEEAVLTQDQKRNYLKIACGEYEAELAGYGLEEYPDLEAQIPEEGFTLNSPDLAQALGQCAYAASTDETRYNLNGVLLDVLKEPEELAMVSTDGHRMAVSTLPHPGSAKGMRPMIVPRNAVREIQKMARSSEALQLRAGERAVELEAPGIRLSARLIEAEYPAWKSVIPEESKAHADVESSQLIQLMQYAIAASDERSHSIVLEFRQGEIEARASRQDDCKAEARIHAEYGGEPLKIGLNARYLREAVEHLPKGTIRMALKTANHPVHITPVSGEEEPAPGPKAQAIVMPMRI